MGATETILAAHVSGRFRLLLSLVLSTALVATIYNEVHNSIKAGLLKVETARDAFDRLNDTTTPPVSSGNVIVSNSNRPIKSMEADFQDRHSAGTATQAKVLLNTTLNHPSTLYDTSQNDKTKPAASFRGAKPATFKATSIEEIVNGTSTTLSEKAAALSELDMDNPEMASVYSLKALSQLEALKLKLKLGKPVTLVVNGGSASAGSPNVAYNDRYFVQFVNRMTKSDTFSRANVTIMDRAHGSRNTMHSAHLIPSFMPEKVDILIWEFAINDGQKEADVRNALILWLRNIEVHISPPPLIILVYLWKSAFQETSMGKIACRTFDQHRSLGAEYDFVLGHVNMAAYLTSLQWDFRDLKAAFVADIHHPTALFHHVMAKHLWQFFSSASEQAPKKSQGTALERSQNQTDLDWICGTNTPEQRQIHELYAVTKGIARGSYVGSMPRNPNSWIRSGMLVPESTKPLEFKQFGVQIALRYDRQMGIVLPCCNSSNLVEFDTSGFGHIHALMLTLRCEAERRFGIQIILDGTVMKKPSLIRPSDWDCLLGGCLLLGGSKPTNGEVKSLDVDLVPISRTAKTVGFCDIMCSRETPLPLVSVSVL